MPRKPQAAAAQTLRQACEHITEIVHRRGLTAATCDDVLDVVAAWLDGGRGVLLPRGILGLEVAVILDHLTPNERARLASLKRGGA